MGFLVEWHIPKRKFDFDILNTLPSDLWTHVFEIDEYDFNFIYADFHSRKVFPQSFDSKYGKLNKLHELLIDEGVEVALNLQVINLNLWLSNTLKDDVFSIDSNDGQLDLAVQSKSGSLSRLRFRAEDIEVLFENDEIHIFPLISEMDGPIVDVEKFDKKAFIIHPREKELTGDLHEIAAEETSTFLKIKPQAIGLATLDFDEECLHRVFTGKNEERRAPQDRTERVAPEENKHLSLKTRFALIMSTVFVVSAFNIYKEYEKSGHLDPSWYIAIGVTIMLVLVIFAVLPKKK